MAADEQVTIRIALRDAITAGLVKIEKQADRTGAALEDMGTRGGKGLRKQNEETTAGLAKVEGQADKTGGALERMGTSGAKGLRKQNQEVKVAEKGLRGLRLKAMDLGFVMKALKVPALATAFNLALPALSALTAQAVAFTGALLPAAGLVGAMPGGILAMVSAMGVVKLATGGVGDALKAMTKEGAKAKDVEAALKGLPPAAREFVKQLAGMKKAMKPLREAAAAGMLPGLGKALRHLVPLIAVIRPGVAALAKTIGDLAHEGGQLLGSAGFKKDIPRIMETNNRVIRLMGQGVLHLVNAFRNLVVAAGPLLITLADGFRRMAAWLSMQSAIGRDSGKLEAFFFRAWKVASRFGRTIRDFGIGLFNVFSGGRKLGDDMHDSLERIAGSFRKWTESTKGREAITRWFKDSKRPMAAFGKLVVAVVKALGRLSVLANKPGSGLAETFDAIRLKLLPVLESLIGGVGSKLGPALVNIAAGFAAFLNLASFGPLITFVEWLGKAAAWFAEWSTNKSETSDTAHSLATSFAVVALAVKGLGTALVAAKIAGKLTGISKVMKSINPTTAGGVSSVIAKTANSVTPSKEGGVTSFGRALRKPKTKVLPGGLAGPVAPDMSKSAKFGKFLRNPIAVTKSTKAFKGLGMVLSKMANPVGLIIAGIVLLGIAVYAAYKKFKPFREFVDRLWQSLQRLWDDVILPGIQILWEFAQKVWDVYLKFTPFGIFLNHFIDILGAVWKAAKFVWEVLQTWWPVLVTIFEKFTPLGRLFAVIRDNWPAILEAVKAAWDIVTEAVGKAVDKLQILVDKFEYFRKKFEGSTAGKFVLEQVANFKMGAEIVKSDFDKGAAMVGRNLTDEKNAAKVNGRLKGPVKNGGDWGDTRRPRAKKKSRWEKVTDSPVGKAVGAVGRFLRKDQSRGLNDWNLRDAIPDRGKPAPAPPRGASGEGLAQTLRQHAAINSRVPGKRTVTNAMYGKYASSDHPAGRALDLQGSNLGAYRNEVRTAGGYAEMHGSGADRHLHAAYGDTTRPRAERAGGSGGTTVLEFNGPLIGQVVANKEIDVANAVKRGIREFVRERQERK